MKILFVFLIFIFSSLYLIADDESNQNYNPPANDVYNSNAGQPPENSTAITPPPSENDIIPPLPSAREQTAKTNEVLYDIKTTHGSIMIKKSPITDSQRIDSNKKQILPTQNSNGNNNPKPVSQ